MTVVPMYPMERSNWHHVTTGVAIYWVYKLLLVFTGLVYIAVTQREPLLCLIVGNLAAFTIADVTDAMVMQMGSKDDQPKRPPTRLDTTL